MVVEERSDDYATKKKVRWRGHEPGHNTQINAEHGMA
jgi:hypothetical protein